MPHRARPTQHSTIGRAFGGRSGFVSQELDHRDLPPEQMSRWERASARLTWDEVANHYEEYEDENHLRFGRLVPSAEMVICIVIVLVFFGGFAAFIAALALTR